MVCQPQKELGSASSGQSGGEKRLARRQNRRTAGAEEDSHQELESRPEESTQGGSVLVSGVPWGPRDPVSGGRGPRENWILYKFDQKLAVGGPRKDGRGPRAAETY